MEKQSAHSVHKEQKFPCPQCKYRATRKGSLQTHIKSVHEGQKFHCPQCEYKVTWKILLQKHVKSVHGKVKSEYFETDVKSEDDFDIKI